MKKEMKNAKRNKKIFLLFVFISIIFILASVFLSVATAQSSREKVYQIELSVDKEANVELRDIRLVEDYATDDSTLNETTDGVMKAQIISKSNKILLQKYFRPTFVVFTDPPTILDKTLFLLNIPYTEDGKYLKIYYKGKEKLAIEIKDNLCNNDGRCNNYENYYSCPDDCGKNAKDNTCTSKSNDSICDPDCYFDKDCISLDFDKDGSLNEEDLCANTTKTQEVMLAGCSCIQILVYDANSNFIKQLNEIEPGIYGKCTAIVKGAEGKGIAITGKVIEFVKETGYIFILLFVFILVIIYFVVKRQLKRKSEKVKK